MIPNILALGTAVPPFFYSQDELCSALKEQLNLEEALAVKMEKIFKHARIDKRHTVARVNMPPFSPSLTPSTAERNAIYKEIAPDLAEQAARAALQKWDGEITHVIAISCTGMMAPGIEFLLIDRLGLSRRTKRLGVNFMGCFGGFKGLSIAKALAQQNAKHRVLVVCVELCSLHFQNTPTMETFVANALFADGAAAAIVGQEKGLWSIENDASLALEDSLNEMTWESSDQGYRMRLTEKVPMHVRQHIKAFLPHLAGTQRAADCDFALHPGGKAILHILKQVFNLTDEQVAPSYDVMREYGNLSSASILFVLDALLKTRTHSYTVGLGFGPGLSVEGILLKRP